MKIVVQPVARSQTKPKPGPVNHVWIFDRSGSMHHTLPGLIRDMKAHKRILKTGDTLSLAWFSTEGGQFPY